METATIQTVGIQTTSIGGKKTGGSTDVDFYVLAEDGDFLTTEDGDYIVRK